MCVCVAQVCASGYYYPPQFHRATSIAVDGSSIEIEDGSIWKINPEQQYEIREWLPEDPLSISPNTSVFGSGNYYITNKARNIYVEANLHLGPILKGEFTKRIISIDYTYGELILEDGAGYRTTWMIDSGDRRTLNTWYLDQAVIVGTNDSWLSGWFSSSDSILINVERNCYIRAREY